MLDQDKKNFKSMMNAVANIYSKPEMTKDTLRIWWAKLNSYEFQEISKAFDIWVDHNKFMPTISDISESIKLTKPKEFIRMLPRHATPLTIEHNKAKMIEALSQLKPKSNDFKKWAKRILDLHAKGEYKIDIGIKFAKEALRGGM